MKAEGNISLARTVFIAGMAVCNNRSISIPDLQTLEQSQELNLPQILLSTLFSRPKAPA